MRPEAFVLVACGPRRHLERLEGAVRRLRAVCENPVWVVTDEARNERPLEVAGLVEQLVDVRTDAVLSDRQASIVLKTSLLRRLPRGGTWCYLDTDVIAVRPGVDQVFLHHRGGATFAADCGRLRDFSCHAVRCGCSNEALRELEGRIQSLLARFARPDPALAGRWQELQRTLSLWAGPVATARDRARRLRFLGSRVGFRWDEADRTWSLPDGRLVHCVEPLVPVARRTGCSWDEAERAWRDPQGRVLFGGGGCDHLQEAILETFGVRVGNGDWQNWNGGVFVFDDTGSDLLDLWHRWTLQIFADSRWRVRDQGTLIAAAWKLGLQDQPLLPPAFNAIAIHDNHDLVLYPGHVLSLDGGRTTLRPWLVHAMHGWDDPGWSLWGWLSGTVPVSEDRPPEPRPPIPLPPSAAPRQISGVARILAFPGHALRAARGHARRLRVTTWWRYVVPASVGVAYATSLVRDVPVPAMAAALVPFLLSAFGLAGFGYAVNDVFDIAADSRAGKQNGMVDLTPGRRRTLLFGLLALGLAPWAVLPCTPFAVGLLALQVVLLISYAAPPLRLKTRGIAGPLADVGYGHVVPALLAVAAFAPLGAAAPPPPALLAAGLATIGLRGLGNILGHQLADRLNDEAAGAETYVLTRGPRRAARERNAVLLLEAVGLLATLVLLWPWAALVVAPLAFAAWSVLTAGAGRWALRSRRRWPQTLRHVLNDLHEEWLPATALALLAGRDSRAAPLLLLHLVLFPNLAAKVRTDAVKAGREVFWWWERRWYRR